jgi:hypothetical protein
MTGNTLGIFFLINSGFMASNATDVMSVSKRERCVIKIGFGPSIGSHTMTFNTIGWVA